jgi:hypothetical protein
MIFAHCKTAYEPYQERGSFQDAFQKLKRQFQEGPILIMADQKKLFYLETDALAFVSGAILMQKDSNGLLHPCGYLSRMFFPTEQHYQIYNCKLLTLI